MKDKKQGGLTAFARQFRTIMKAGRRFLVVTHVRPDGDAYGCMLAIAHSLRMMRKKIVLWNEDGVVDRYRFLPGSDWISSETPPSGSFDARIVVDTASMERAGKISMPSDRRSPIINIDHHASNPGYGDLVYVEPSRASCGEVIFDLLRLAKMPVPKEAAECLFVAISTDTGSFQYPSVTPSTFRIAADLLEYGLDLGEITRRIYESYPPRRLLLLREVLQSARFDSGDRIGYFWIDAGSYRRSGARPEDSEALIDHVRSIHSVRVAVLFEEIAGERTVRISLRSKDRRVDVNRVARQFGGGGHPAAAGARIQGGREEVEQRVLEAVRMELASAEKA